MELLDFKEYLDQKLLEAEFAFEELPNDITEAMLQYMQEIFAEFNRQLEEKNKQKPCVNCDTIGSIELVAVCGSCGKEF